MQAANNGNGPRGRTGGVPGRDRVPFVDPCRRDRGADGDLRPAWPRRARALSASSASAATPHRSAPRRIGSRRRPGSRTATSLPSPHSCTTSGDWSWATSTARSSGWGPSPTTGPRSGSAGSDASWVSTTRWSVPSLFAAGAFRLRSRRRSSGTTAPDADGIAAVVQLADLIVHHAAGDRVSPASLRSAAARVGLDEDGLRGILFEYPHAGEHPAVPPSRARCRRARSTPCAASRRARSTSRSPRSSRSRSRRSARTFTTSTRRSALWTAPRPS